MITNVRHIEKVGVPEVVQDPLGPVPAIIYYCDDRGISCENLVNFGAVTLEFMRGH